MRLDKFLANAGVGTRSEVKDLIKMGVVLVNNELIQDKKIIRTKLCKGMWGLGVPEDLEKFRKDYLKEIG